VREIRAKPAAPVWRQDEGGGQSYALKLTAAGAKAIPAGDHSASDSRHEDSDKRTQLASADPEVLLVAAEDLTTNVMRPSAPRAGTKLARILELLRRDHGATLNELISATGWLPHTTRAALTGLRKRRYAVTVDRSNKERGSTYRARYDEPIDVEQAGSSSDEPPRPSAARISKKAQRSEKPEAQAAA
jgi:hypothetical protein